MKKCKEVRDITGNNPPVKNANHLFKPTISSASVPIDSHIGNVNSTQDLNNSPSVSISL